MARQKKQQEGGGFQQSAGLIRYFEAEEESAIQIDPRIVVGIGAAISAITWVLGYFYPL